jgi:hypothetical protein
LIVGLKVHDMTSAKNFNSVVTDWLTRLVSGQRVAFTQSAQRFAALLSSESELEAAGPEVAGTSSMRATLKVGTGLHAGACLKLTSNLYLVGCAEDCDIVLRDSHIAAHHCRLIRGWAGFSVRDMRSESAPLVAPTDIKYDGGSIEVRYEVGGLQFTVCQPPPAGMTAEVSAGNTSPVYRMLLPAVMVSVLVGAVALAGMEQVGKHHAALQADQPAARGAGFDENTAARLTEQARSVLADDRLKVELKDGRLLIEGATAQTALKTRIQALATDLRGTIPVEDRITYLAEDESGDGPGPLPMRVQSVMVGPPGYFITDTGARYFVGGVLPDGAEVVSISAGEIRFTRAGRSIVYELQ